MNTNKIYWSIFIQLLKTKENLYVLAKQQLCEKISSLCLQKIVSKTIFATF